MFHRMYKCRLCNKPAQNHNGDKLYCHSAFLVGRGFHSKMVRIPNDNTFYCPEMPWPQAKVDAWEAAFEAAMKKLVADWRSFRPLYDQGQCERLSYDGAAEIADEAIRKWNDTTIAVQS